MNRAERRQLTKSGRSCPYGLCGGKGDFYKNEHYGIVPCPCSLEDAVDATELDEIVQFATDES